MEVLEDWLLRLSTGRVEFGEQVWLDTSAHIAEHVMMGRRSGKSVLAALRKLAANVHVNAGLGAPQVRADALPIVAI